MQKYFEMVQEFEKKFRMAQASVQEEKHEILGIKVNSDLAPANLQGYIFEKFKKFFSKRAKFPQKKRLTFERYSSQM